MASILDGLGLEGIRPRWSRRLAPVSIAKGVVSHHSWVDPAASLTPERTRQRWCWVMADVLDFVEPGPLLSDEAVKPPIVSKAIEMQMP